MDTLTDWKKEWGKVTTTKLNEKSGVPKQTVKGIMRTRKEIKKLAVKLGYWDRKGTVEKKAGEKRELNAETRRKVEEEANKVRKLRSGEKTGVQRVIEALLNWDWERQGDATATELGDAAGMLRGSIVNILGERQVLLRAAEELGYASVLDKRPEHGKRSERLATRRDRRDAKVEQRKTKDLQLIEQIRKVIKKWNPKAELENECGITAESIASQIKGTMEWKVGRLLKDDPEMKKLMSEAKERWKTEGGINRNRIRKAFKEWKPKKQGRATLQAISDAIGVNDLSTIAKELKRDKTLMDDAIRLGYGQRGKGRVRKVPMKFAPRQREVWDLLNSWDREGKGRVTGPKVRKELDMCKQTFKEIIKSRDEIRELAESLGYGELKKEKKTGKKIEKNEALDPKLVKKIKKVILEWNAGSKLITVGGVTGRIDGAKKKEVAAIIREDAEVKEMFEGNRAERRATKNISGSDIFAQALRGHGF
ncbi:Uncharacterised protein [Candidatus Gugararchaeum adminiculabundum]|nr:Uncharacterised protein [Candidatus Gugararchaeum adminiculabundum]